MSKNAFWYGYLEAGTKSSAVLRDPSLESGSKKTLLLFNLARDEIIEYTREIVEPKLRELASSESDLVNALEGAYGSARQRFKGSRKAIADIPEKGSAKRASNDSDSDDDGEFDDFEDSDEILDDDSGDDADEDD